MQPIEEATEMRHDTASELNDELRKLVERWCDRREYRALATLLPAWCASNSQSDGMGELRDAVRSIDALCGDLPNEDHKRLRDLGAKLAAAASEPAKA